MFGNPEVWQWPPPRAYHVENYRLKLHFDQAQGEVIGDEVVTLRPFLSHFRKFYLDSSGLQVDAVELQPAQSSAIRLQFAAEDPRLWITLDRDYDEASELNVRIVYHGFPKTGLFFINPTRAYPNWPREIWSQGETEFNHYWFPCWDYPNDMATSETITTVPEGQVVVSNGKLVSVTHSAGQAIYDWKESVPHSSYLISIAVGPWRKVSDQYEGKPVDYYVPQYVDEATARRSFHLTPDMLAFFSRATGVDWPYEQYAQVTAHNYLFGGMENVSATTLTEWTLHDERADQDYPSTDLVSHELGQEWLGDYVQGRDWANIWLNEGFATYLEALYVQHHEGNDAFRYKMYMDQMAEQAQDREDYRRPIVDRHYTDPMQMFDAITHEKGAAVLDMLRYLLDGADAASHPASQEEPFFRAVRHYLISHSTQTADTADLMDAVRATTGQELGWFFHEWVFMAGHPDYDVQATYDSAKKMERLTVRQTQRADSVTPIFDMPILIAFHGANGEHKRVQVRDHLASQEFDIPLDFQPQWVAFDPDDFIDKTLHFSEAADALIAQVKKDSSMMSRLWAVQQLGAVAQPDVEKAVAALARVLENDAFYGVRAAAAASLGTIGTETAKSALLSALKQPDSRVRTAAVQALGRFAKDPAAYGALVSALHSDNSYAVEAAAAEALGKSGVPQAFEVLQAEVAANTEVHVMRATLDGLAVTKDPRAIPILFAKAQAGQMERVRLTALAGLTRFAQTSGHAHAQEMTSVVRAALDDPFAPVRQAGARLAGQLHLTQLCPEIHSVARNAPIGDYSQAAEQVLRQLQCPAPGS
ncbi:MAG TPA: HEAT repeat domain-containing protein [Terriglobales bacterium]|nr:HEAT repeat domain-containing protein [Terriglobales bacterium]